MINFIITILSCFLAVYSFIDGDYQLGVLSLILASIWAKDIIGDKERGRK